MANQKPAQLPAYADSFTPPKAEDRDRILDSFEGGEKDIPFAREVRKLLTGFGDEITLSDSGAAVARNWCYTGVSGCDTFF